MNFLYALLIGYFFGSILGAVVLSKLLDFPDPRQHGSKNPGTSNVVRVCGLKNGLWVLLMDMVKGALTILVIEHIVYYNATTNYAIVGIGCIGAVIGHLYPIWFKFKGGKGVATFIGCLLAINILVGLVALVVWALLMLLLRVPAISSIVSILVGTAVLIINALQNSQSISAKLLFPVTIAAAIIIWAHRDNIKRLKEGNENKI
jgi:acyl phosphate:glycerol-3-phosphate acyltransferase